MKYHLEDSYECYDYLAQDLKAEGEVSVAVGQLFALNQEKVAQAFLKQVCLIKGMDDIVKQQITLVEAANATPYGWNVAKYLENEMKMKGATSERGCLLILEYQIDCVMTLSMQNSTEMY